MTIRTIVSTALAASALILASAGAASAAISTGSVDDARGDVVIEKPGFEVAKTSDLRETTVTVRKHNVDVVFEFTNHKRGTVQGVYAKLDALDFSADRWFLAWSPAYPAGVYKETRNGASKRFCDAAVTKTLGMHGTLAVTIDRQCFTPSQESGWVTEILATRAAVEGYADYKMTWRDYSTRIQTVA